MPAKVDPKAPASPALQAGASSADRADLQAVPKAGQVANQHLLPAAPMPPSVAAVGPLADFVVTLSDHVQNYLKAQNFTEWS